MQLVNAARRLMGGAPPSQHQTAPLLIASQQANSQMVDALLRGGAEVNATDDTGATSLLIACSRAAECAKAGASTASARQRPILSTIIDHLLRNGADVNLADNCGMTPIWRAAGAGDLHLFDLLIRFGGRVRPRDGFNKPVWDDVFGYAEADNRKPPPALVKGLLDNGALIDDTDPEGFTALMIAAGDGDNDIVRLLLARGADFKIRATIGSPPTTYTAMSWAQAFGKTDAVKLLHAASSHTNRAAHDER